MSNFSLLNLGWHTFFQQQLSLQECTDAEPMRLMHQHRDRWHLCGEAGECIVTAVPDWHVCVGDWMLLQESRPLRLLERQSVFQRRRAGNESVAQLIAVNVDTVLIVMALNHDFNLNRLERYLALINEACAEAVVVLTRADECSEIDDYVDAVQAIDPLLPVLALNALNEADVRQQLQPWCRPGRTLAVMGSSGVGKSTLSNALLGSDLQLTGGIRADDSKGRHTTTGRSLLCLDNGALLMDMPGMRELQLTQCQQGLEQTFADVGEWVAQCRFSDCQHQQEPDCAIRAALEDGRLDERRWRNYLKLQREEARNSATLAERRQAERRFAHHARTVVAQKKLLRS